MNNERKADELNINYSMNKFLSMFYLKLKIIAISEI